MNQVLLYGHLGDRFGKVHHYEIESPLDAIRALKATVDGFEEYMVANSEPGYRVIVGDEEFEKSQLVMHTRKTIKIVPVIAGAGGGGIGSIILGGALIWMTAGMATPLIAGTSISVASIGMSIGSSLVLGGITSMLSSPPDQKQAPTSAANNPSFVMNGAVNVSGQGDCVPVAYGGPMIIGSRVVSGGLEADQA